MSVRCEGMKPRIELREKEREKTHDRPTKQQEETLVMDVCGGE
jgi:hypothetical protein